MTPENLRVLLVDNEVSLRKPLAEYLRQNGFDVDDAADGGEAIQLVEKNRGQYDVALTDYLLLPEMDGIEVMRRIRTAYPEIECVIFTGWGTTERQRALQEGAFRYLEKPFDLEELAWVVRTAAQQVRLRAISRDILSKRDLDQVLDKIIAAVRSLSQADEAVLVQWEEASNTLKLLRAGSDGLAERQEVEQSLPGQALSRSIIQTGRTTSVGEIIADDPMTVGAHEVGFQSFVGVPVSGEQGNLGVLYALSRKPRHFDVGGNVAVLQTLAAQAGVAIANAKAFQQLQAQAADLETLQRLSVAVASSLNLTDVMTRTCQAAVDFFRADHSSLVLFDADLCQGTVVAEYPPDLGTLGERIPVQGIPAEENLVNHGEPLVIQDVAKETDLGPLREALHDTFGIQSVLIVPVVSKGRRLGSFSLDAIDRKREFTRQEVELCKMFAAQVAVAIDNARLYEETRRREQLLAALEDASRHIRGEKEPARLEQEVVRLAAELMDCDAACLFVNFPYRNELELTIVHGLRHDLLGERISDTEGLAGRAVRSGKLTVQYDYDTWPGKDIIFTQCGFKTALAIPLWREEEVTEILFLADTENPNKFSLVDQEIIGNFAIQASIALQTSRAMTKEQRSLSTLAIIRKASDYIQAAGDMEKILHVVLTGVTAGYGLGFNRSALLLLDDAEKVLSGRIGIGQFTEDQARKAWKVDRLRGPDNFDRYIDLLEKGEIRSTPVGERIRSLELRADANVSAVFSQVLTDQRLVLVSEHERDLLPHAFLDAFAPAFPLIIAPLVARGRSIGILVADNRFTRSPITEEAIATLQTFVNTASIAIYNAQLYQQTRSSQEQLRSYYEASNTIVTSTDVDQVLEDIVERAKQTARAHSVGMVLLNDAGQVRKMIVSGAEQPTDVSEMVRPSGLSVQVMRSGRPIVVEDTTDDPEKINPSEFWHDIKAAMCLPVVLEGRSLGVMWFYYPAPRTFSQHEIEAAQLYVNQAAVAYDSARRVEELEQMRRAAEALAKVTKPQQALQQIVESAAIVLHADSVAVWSYDDVRDKFIPEELAAFGIADAELAILRETEPKPGQTADTVMRQGYVYIDDMADPKYGFIGQPTRDLLQRIGMRSFQAVSLLVGEERLGVLYANYYQQRAFGEEQETTIKTFASHAALALKTARLMTQLERTKQAAGVVAGAVVQQDLRLTLDEIADNTREVLDADVVTVYAYDETKGKFTEEGISIVDQKMPDSIRRSERLLGKSAPYRILAVDEAPHHHLVDDNAINDSILGGFFVEREEVRAAIGVQLRANEHKVGVMFVNFRSAHRFTDDEISTVRLFADQAAAAIRNTQLYRQTARLLDQSRLVSDISREAASNLEIGAFLETLFSRLTAIFTERQTPIFPSLATYDKTDESLVTYNARFYPSEARSIRTSIEARGIMAWVAREGRLRCAPDVSVDPNYNPLLVDTRSEIAVPVFYDDELLAVLNLESPVLNAFTMEDQELLLTLASQIAVTLHNVQQYADLKRTKGLVGSRTALAWMGMVGAQWMHGIVSNAVTIRDNAMLLRSELGSGTDRTNELLDRMDRLLDTLMQSPVPAALGDEQGIESVMINRLLKDRLRQLWQRERYGYVELEFDFQIGDTTAIQVDPRWFVRALDCLIDNAVRAVSNTGMQKITVRTEESGGGVDILISDTGPGIPADIRPRLFISPIERSDSGALGMGLLLAQIIVETYRGDIRVAQTGPHGTTMAIWLPMQNANHLAAIRPPSDKAGTALDWYVLYNDLLRAHKELKELDRKKTEFLSTVSHELRTPLTPVLSCIENLLSGMYGSLNSRQTERLEIALSKTREETRLVTNLLDLARLEENRMTLDLESASMAQVILDVFHIYEIDARQKGISFTAHLPPADALELEIDIVKIKQVLNNLVSNALKFTPENGQIQIHALRQELQIEVQVNDTGIGVADAEREKIFERFYQVDSSLTRKTQGAGVGLSIAKSIIQLHRGKIWVESEPGHGSTFFFTLPLTQRIREQTL